MSLLISFLIALILSYFIMVVIIYISIKIQEMKELQRRTIGLLVLCFSIIALILTLDHSYNKRFEAQEHRLNEQKRLLIALTHKVNENNIYKNTGTK